MYYLHQDFDFRVVEDETFSRLGIDIPNWVRPSLRGNIDKLPGMAFKAFYFDNLVLKDSIYWGKWRPGRGRSNPDYWKITEEQILTLENEKSRRVLIPVSSISVWPEQERKTATIKFKQLQTMPRPDETFKTLVPESRPWGMLKGIWGMTLKQEKSGVKKSSCFLIVEKKGSPIWVPPAKWAAWLRLCKF